MISESPRLVRAIGVCSRSQTQFGNESTRESVWNPGFHELCVLCGKYPALSVGVVLRES